MKWDKIASTVFAALGAAASYLWGRLDVIFIALLTLMALDFATGIMCGIKKGELDSHRAYIGITRKKMMILIMVAVAVVLDRLLNAPDTARALVIYYYIAMEGISILENAAKLDFPVPSKLKDALLQLKKEKDDQDA